MLEVNGFELFVLSAFALLEYWLGRTTKTEAGSLIELVILLIKKILKNLKK